MSKKHTTLFTLGLLASVSVFGAAQANDDTLKPVYDRQGDFAIDKQDDCIVTKWQAEDGGCNPPEVVVAEPVVVPPSPIRRLTREEKTVYFKFDKYDLTGATKTRLDTVVNALRRSKDVERVDIVGYADEIGTESYNQRLSAKRANAVASYLESRGIHYAEVTDVRALGELAASPRCKDVTSRTRRIACLAPDRRVEVEVVYADDN